MAHRKTIRHFHQPGELHEFTFSCYHRMQLLTDEGWLEKLSRHLDAANVECRINLVAFVFMPEHIHLLIDPLDPKPDIGFYLARVKQPFSKEIKGLLVQQQSPLLRRLTVQERPGKMCFRFWQEGPGFDRNLSSEQAILAAIDYIHRNPVRRELCERAIEWFWSSARYYLAEPPRQQNPRLPFIHGLRAGTLT